MSYTVGIVDKEGANVVLPKCHAIVSGTYAVGGTHAAWLDVTYNYAPIFVRVMGNEGIKLLNEKDVREAMPILNQAITALGDALADANYWKATEGNVRRVLEGLRDLAELALEVYPQEEMFWSINY